MAEGTQSVTGKQATDLAASFIAEGRLAEARKIVDVLLVHLPTDPYLLQVAGGLAMNEQRLDEAISLYDRVLSVHPEATQLHWNLALALLTAGQFKRGWRELEWGERGAALGQARA